MLFFENLSIKFKFRENLTRITCTLHGDLSTFVIISRRVLLRMRNVSDKSCTENQNTHFVCSNIFFSENRAVYELIWRKRGRVRGVTDDNIITAHALCALGTQGYKHTLRIYNTNCFSATTVVHEHASNLPLHLYCLSPV
jgi:hypothetical protein